MKIHRLHSWDATPQEAVLLQEQLRAKIIPRGRVPKLTLVAGADAAFDLQAHRVLAAVVILMFSLLEPVEMVVHQKRVSFPYIPALLSFREAPALHHAFETVRHDPDVVFIDGHGLSHPRSAGIACHLGVCLDKDWFREVSPDRHASSARSLAWGRYVALLCNRPNRWNGRSDRDRVNPVFVSVGHRIGLSQAVQLTLACGKGYRIPEPTRQADRLAERVKQGDLEK